MPRTLRTAAASVADLLDQHAASLSIATTAFRRRPAAPLDERRGRHGQHVDALDRNRPPEARSGEGRQALGVHPAPPARRRWSKPARPASRETAYAVTRTHDRRALHRTALVSRVLRAPRARIVAEGIGEYAALSAARRAAASRGTLRLASAALSMVATAYTASCAGCSGTTASGRPAGHGIVAVDPRVIPLGTRMYIPGYGHAVAGDTGGAIRGNRIDLGFNSNRQAFQFGRRPVTVYLIK